MALKISSMTGAGVIGAVGGRPFIQKVEILADTAAEISALGKTVTDKYGNTVIPSEGSIAYTADMSVGYQLSPSGVWTKFM